MVSVVLFSCGVGSSDENVDTEISDGSDILAFRHTM